MSNDIPEIDELLSGINEPALKLGKPRPTEAVVSKQAEPAQETVAVPPTPDILPDGLEQFWQDTLDILRNDSHPRNRTAYCMIDRDLAETLDECRIFGNYRAPRTSLVNAFVRVAIKTFLPKLAEYRRESNSFFQPPKEPQP